MLTKEEVETFLVLLDKVNKRATEVCQEHFDKTHDYHHTTSRYRSKREFERVTGIDETKVSYLYDNGFCDSDYDNINIKYLYKPTDFADFTSRHNEEVKAKEAEINKKLQEENKVKELKMLEELKKKYEA